MLTYTLIRANKEFLYTGIRHPLYHVTDHLIVVSYFMDFIRKSKEQPKLQSDRAKRKFVYDQISDEKWLTFEQTCNRLARKQNLSDAYNLDSSLENINILWNCIKHIILKNASAH